MLAGKLDRRVTFQRATNTRNDFGENVEAWADLFTTWCRKEPIRGAESVIAAETVDRAFVKITIRYRAELMTTDRFVFEGRPWRIQSMGEVGRQDGLELMGESRTDMVQP